MCANIPVMSTIFKSFQGEEFADKLAQIQGLTTRTPDKGLTAQNEYPAEGIRSWRARGIWAEGGLGTSDV